MEDMRQDLERLLKLKRTVGINETDYDEVSEKHNTTREEVIDCLMAMESDNIDMSEDCSCEKCDKVISLEEASAFNGSCEECDNKEGKCQ